MLKIEAALFFYPSRQQISDFGDALINYKEIQFNQKIRFTFYIVHSSTIIEISALSSMEFCFQVFFHSIETIFLR